MGPNTDDNRSKARGYLRNEEQILDIQGVRAVADSERPVALSVLRLVLTGMHQRLSAYQYSKANIVDLVTALQGLHTSLMGQKRFQEAEQIILLIQEVQHIQRSGYMYPYPARPRRK